MATEYFTKKILETSRFYVEPEIDHGYSWDSDDRYEVIQEANCLEGGMVSIENMRKALDEFEKQGAISPPDYNIMMITPTELPTQSVQCLLRAREDSNFQIII